MVQQRLQQRMLQTLKLSPQQILLMKLLQIPSIALEQRIKQEIEENPALEDITETGETDDVPTNDEDASPDHTDDDNETDDEITTSSDDEFGFEDYLADDDYIPDYRTSINNSSADDDHRDIPYSAGKTFQEYLISQLGLRYLSGKQYIIGVNLIGNIDDNGYLTRDIHAMVDDLAFTQNVEATIEEILEVLKILQELDPPGVGARNLQECLIIQLKRRQDKSETLEIALNIIERYFDEFTKKHYDRIQKRAKISDEELKAAINEILKLNPKPGNSSSETEKTTQYILPDFFIYSNNGELELALNNRNTPELRVSRDYFDMLETYSGKRNKSTSQDKEAVMFIKQKIDSAKWFIDAIKQRQNTLYMTMKAIMDYQYEYFNTGDETKLKPMILKDIAEKVNLDISTISRVSNSKYVQTPYGTFLLKSFFSESMETEDGDEVSTRELKKILQNAIEAESKKKPLTDEQLTKLLKLKGYKIARRTVAKYREQLNIPAARLRKELH